MDRSTAPLKRAYDGKDQSRDDLPDPDRTALYRLFDPSGALLYVGISTDPEKRLKSHRWGPDRKRWRGEIHRMTTEWFERRIEAERAEIAAIGAELPRHNRRHHPGWEVTQGRSQ